MKPCDPIYPRTFIELAVHLLCAVGGAAVVFVSTRRLDYAALFFTGGVFIDLDHLLDYFLYAKNRFLPHEFFGHFQLSAGRVYLLAHSWELIIGLLLLGAWLPSYGLFVLSLGFCIHLLVDNLQRKNPWVYFLAYRIYRKFEVRVLLPECQWAFAKEMNRTAQRAQG